MTVRELIQLLEGFDPAFSVTITDGFRARFYNTDAVVATAIQEDDGKWSVDLGIGDCCNDDGP